MYKWVIEIVSFSLQPGSKLKGKGEKERNLEPYFKWKGSEHSDMIFFFPPLALLVHLEGRAAENQYKVVQNNIFYPGMKPCWSDGSACESIGQF